MHVVYNSCRDEGEGRYFLMWEYFGPLKVRHLSEPEQLNMIIANMRLRGVDEHLIATMILLKEGDIKDDWWLDGRKAEELWAEGINIEWVVE